MGGIIMTIDEMPKDLLVEIYSITLLELEAETRHLELIKKYGCTQKREDPEYCLRNYTNMVENKLNTLKVFWKFRAKDLEDAGFERIAGDK